MNKWKEISYPSMFVDLADELAELRTFHSKHVYKEGTEKYRGDREHKISMLGILSELIAAKEVKVLLGRENVLFADTALDLTDDVTSMLDVAAANGAENN